MYEVEVKERLQVPAARAERSLARNGFSFGDPVLQDDIVYARQASDVTEWQPGISVARIRTEGSRSMLTVKTFTEVPLVKIEHETTVGEPREAAAILKALGLQEVVHIQKRRRTGTKGNLTACVDEVSGLGVFAEFELLYSEAPPAAAQEELHQLAVDLLPGSVSRVLAGYDELVLAATGDRLPSATTSDHEGLGPAVKRKQ